MIVGDESVTTDKNAWRPAVPEELQDYNWDKANVNDLVEMYTRYVPAWMWLEVSGDPDGLCYLPWLCLCVWLNITVIRLTELLDPNWGKFLAGVPGLEKGGDMLKRRKTAKQQPIWRQLKRGLLVHDPFIGPVIYCSINHCPLQFITALSFTYSDLPFISR